MGHSNRLLLAAAVAVIGCVATISLLLYRIIQKDGLMIFPNPAHGSFLENPKLTTDGKKVNITWKLATKCDYNEYEVQEKDYAPGSNKLWGGMNANCVESEGSYLCRADIHPEMSGGGEWVVQAKAFGCAQNGYYISQPTPISF